MMGEEKLKVLLAGAECVPFAKTGGLADVLGTLPGQLVKLGVDARVIMPLHGEFKHRYINLMSHLCDFYINLGWRRQYVGIETMVLNDVRYYFVDNEYYFKWAIYKGGEMEGEQYAFFTRAVIDAIPYIGWTPDIINANDWHTAAIPMLLKTQYGQYEQGKIKTVFTIHNLIYQGKFHFGFISDLLGIHSKYYSPQYLEAYGCANLLKAALIYSDKLSTVSPTYANELFNPYFAEGMEGVLWSRKDDLVGILNGIDTEVFNPENDNKLAASYSIDDLSGKLENKRALISELGLSIPDSTPIIGIVTRLTKQKGLELIKHVLWEIMQEDVAIVVLGAGDHAYESFFHDVSYRYCGRFAIRTEYNEALAHRIYAGSDLFLMPSRFEPCGISQMIALRYGTLPIVRETGGLADTVKAYNEFTGEGNGFSFANYNAHDMLNVIRLAIDTYRDSDTFKAIMRNAMKEDNSFSVSARKYLEMYKDSMASPQRIVPEPDNITTIVEELEPPAVEEELS